MSRSHPLTRRRRPLPPKASPPPSSSKGGCQTTLLALGLCVLLGGALVMLFLWGIRNQPPQTYLLLGVDQRPGEQGPTRSDVIVLAHADPAAGRGVLLSVPRDLWLPQPHGTTNRINTAVVNGYDPSDPDAGPRYLAQTLTTNFGVPIDGYVLINFEGFVRIVDAAGGVTVNVPVAIVDETYPTTDFGVQTIRFDAGEQHLNGERALIYVRTRHQDSDFGRAARQQQVIQALAQKLVRPQHWWRIPGVAFAAFQSMETDLTPMQIPALVAAGLTLASGDVEQLVLDENYVAPWTTERGASVLLPRWEAIQPAIQRRFTSVE